MRSAGGPGRADFSLPVCGVKRFEVLKMRVYAHIIWSLFPRKWGNMIHGVNMSFIERIIRILVDLRRAHGKKKRSVKLVI